MNNPTAQVLGMLLALQPDVPMRDWSNFVPIGYVCSSCHASGADHKPNCSPPRGIGPVPEPRSINRGKR